MCSVKVNFDINHFGFAIDICIYFLDLFAIISTTFIIGLKVIFMQINLIIYWFALIKRKQNEENRVLTL